MRIKTLLFLFMFLAPLTVTPAAHHIEGVALADQGGKPWCGPVSIVMVLNYWGFNVTVEEVGMAVDPEENGMKVREMVRYLEPLDVTLYEVRNVTVLKTWIARNHPVIVLMWADDTKARGHYSVVTGYDAEYVYLNDPNGFRVKRTYSEFFLLWTRYKHYGLVISPIRTFITEPLNRTVGVK